MDVRRVGPYLWEIPADAKPGMRVPARVVADAPLMARIRTDASLDQLANGAMLPGIVKAAFAMPDIHQGYGLPVGGVVATDAGTGVVSPGAIGFDINCGVRLLATSLEEEDATPRMRALVGALYDAVPTGVGAKGPLSLDRKDLGAVMAEALSGLGITTIGQLQRMPRAVLVRRFGPHGAALHDLAFGRDDRPVEPFTPAKSMGAEETFESDCRDPARLATVLREQAERVARELREAGVAAARLTLKLRFGDFQTITRAVSAEPTQDGLELYRRARALLDRERLDQPVRLIGLSASSLGPAGAGQLSLLDPAALRRERLARVVDGLAARFGDDVVRPASLLPPPPP